MICFLSSKIINQPLIFVGTSAKIYSNERSVNQPDSLISLVAQIPKEKKPGLDREETFEPVAKSAKTTDIGSTSSGIAKKGKGKGKGRGK